LLDGLNSNQILKRGGHPMSLQDKSLQCSDCGLEFAFTVGEQEFYASRGLQNEPKRCPECRRARKAGRYGNNSYESPRQMFPVTCAECGTDTEVPFEPRGDKPVYCRDCYSKVKVS
jgi:CxxC-x17-CxxC domain-containing protein